MLWKNEVSTKSLLSKIVDRSPFFCHFNQKKFLAGKRLKPYRLEPELIAIETRKMTVAGSGSTTNVPAVGQDQRSVQPSTSQQQDTPNSQATQSEANNNVYNPGIYDISRFPEP